MSSHISSTHVNVVQRDRDKIPQDLGKHTIMDGSVYRTWALCNVANLVHGVVIKKMTMEWSLYLKDSGWRWN